MEIWTTPHGFLKAAAANNATSTPSEAGSEVTFTIHGKYKYVGLFLNMLDKLGVHADRIGDSAGRLEYFAEVGRRAGLRPARALSLEPDL